MSFRSPNAAKEKLGGRVAALFLPAEICGAAKKQLQMKKIP